MNEIIKSHRDLDIWIRARNLVKDVYVLTNGFPRSEDSVLKLQMRRAAISVPSNIAEGAARKGTKEYIHFLFIALASLSELETQIFLSEDLGLLKGKDTLLNEVIILRKKISTTINSLKRRTNP